MHKANFYTLENYPLQTLSKKQVRNCIVTRSMLVITALGVSRAAIYPNLPFRKKLGWNGAALASVVINKLHYIDSSLDYYFPLNPWANNYYHWLTEIAPKLLLFEDVLRSGLIVIPKSLQRFAFDFFELFEFKNIVLVGENTFFKKLQVITNPNTNHYNLEHLMLVRKSILARIPQEKANATRRIYVSRKHARARRVSNEDEVVNHLKKLGFECVYLEGASLAEQVNMFRDSDCLISIHGAALTNAMFMPAGSRVIELYPHFIHKEREFSACFYRLCKIFEVEHQFLFFDRVDGSRRLNLDTDDIHVDIDKLDFALSG